MQHADHITVAISTFNAILRNYHVYFYRRRHSLDLWFIGPFRMKKQKSVALLIESSNAYARNLLDGILSYIQTHDSWSVYLPEQHRGAAPPESLAKWKGDGLIVRIETETIADFVRSLGVPVVDVSAARWVPEIPWVETDDKAIARAAFEHFRDRGFESFAFCGDASFKWSNLREAGFVDAVEKAGYVCSVYRSKSPTVNDFSIASERANLANWLLSRPQPVALFTCYDIRSRQVLDICRDYEIHVPEQVALLGVDNDEILCELSTPPLSSVIPAARKAGQVAAGLLDAMMAGKEMERLDHLLEPVGVATRQSTDILAVKDHDVAKALRFIRDSACDGINVQDVLKQVTLSRRTFESRFKQSVGRTPHEEIVRRRVERIQRYLIETDLTLSQIAKRTGFQNEEYMSVTFRRATDVPPGKFRREHL